ncbi:purine permease 3-like [Hevea brasiliensis]|uniref:purine permease 3-like n=1 Tax=Hevea brasiliensis TaxID=3981 RepID=UPI0025FCE97A|nr:purine permease 3-like [Hevea brasiliensis]XP_057989919.1 purine permease 3-like [Hevea brasiliensis]XP_057989920.1 purine permease 3-like [Hevea brasiliensis]XP_057989921.1 purine permease 3-like [Hevea brasiliensis]XP_057989922.1 purine permease 3-like [Hevea brasiliensis]XP_057989923.1 purine permease 3-like [Hevea brasiliensis]
METDISNNQVSSEEEKMSRSLKKFLLVLNGAMLGIGNCGGPLIQRLYFLKGGKGVWISCFLQTAGWPFIIFPLSVSYLYRRRKKGSRTKLFYISPHLFLACAVIGVLTGFDDFLAASGVSLLPVTTYSLIIATQLGFTAGFAYILVKQKFTPFTINAIFLLSVGAVVLVLHASSDRPAHETDKQYIMGFLMTLGASVLYGFVLPLIELTYKKAKQTITYTLVMEMQMVLSFFATAVCTIGMLLHKDFEAIPREARDFELGREKYYVVMVCTAVFWQFFFMGAVGVIFCHSSLLSGIIISGLLPVTEALAVLFYHEKVRVEKVISLVLSIWGFISYFYGELRQIKKLRIRLQN